MTKSPKSAETILREALVVARDELHRLNEYGTVRPDPFGVVLNALQQVPAIPAIENAMDDIERKIAGKVVSCLFDAGYVITVNDGEDDVLVGMTPGKEDLIWQALASTGGDILRVSKVGATRGASFVYLIWGNGVDIISDYGTSLEEVLKPAFDLAEALDDRGQA
jgi:hypothetical protein